MKNVTIALDDEVHRLARIRAAELGTSLSALVKGYLNSLVAAQEPKFAGVRDMQLPFKHDQTASMAKPRQPGGLRQPGKTGNLPDTPDWLIDVMKHWDETDFDPQP